MKPESQNDSPRRVSHACERSRGGAGRVGVWVHSAWISKPYQALSPPPLSHWSHPSKLSCGKLRWKSNDKIFSSLFVFVTIQLMFKYWPPYLQVSCLILCLDWRIALHDSECKGRPWTMTLNKVWYWWIMRTRNVQTRLGERNLFNNYSMGPVWQGVQR